MDVRVIGHDEIGERGLAACLVEAAAIVTAAANGFGITIDLDAFDPAAAPGVGSPEPEGLPVREVHAGLQRLAASRSLLAMEIAEYNPDRDRHGMTAKLICNLIRDILPQPQRARARRRSDWRVNSGR
jgi:arginase